MGDRLYEVVGSASGYLQLHSSGPSIKILGIGGAALSYADGGNAKGDPAELLEDQIVRLDGNHMLGRAVAKFGPIKIPLAYFVLERRQQVPPTWSW